MARSLGLAERTMKAHVRFSAPHKSMMVACGYTFGLVM